MLQNGVGWMTSSSILGMVGSTSRRASAAPSPAAPEIIPVRPTVAPVVPGPPPTAASAPPPVAPTIAPSEMKVTVYLLGYFPRSNYDEDGFANSPKSFGYRRLKRGRALRASAREH